MKTSHGGLQSRCFFRKQAMAVCTMFQEKPYQTDRSGTFNMKQTEDID